MYYYYDTNKEKIISSDEQLLRDDLAFEYYCANSQSRQYCLNEMYRLVDCDFSGRLNMLIGQLEQLVNHQIKTDDAQVADVLKHVNSATIKTLIDDLATVQQAAEQIKTCILAELISN